MKIPLPTFPTIDSSPFLEYFLKIEVRVKFLSKLFRIHIDYTIVTMDLSKYLMKISESAAKVCRCTSQSIAALCLLA